jgi:hypothetical protein
MGMLEVAKVSCIAALALALACSSHATSGTAGSDAAAGEAGAGFAASACGLCVSSACVTPIGQCNSDPECGAAWACIGRCDVAISGNVDEACAARCGTPSTSEGSQHLTLLGNCRTSGPGALCPCGGEAGVSIVDAPSDATCTHKVDANVCRACIEERCCAELGLCDADAQCFALKNCTYNCTTSACEQACYDASPAGIGPYGDLLGCAMVGCAGTAFCGTEDTCGPCVATKCATEMRTCYAKPDCYLDLMGCRAYCATAACYDTCDAKYPAAQTEVVALTTCEYKCGASCM